MEGLIKALVVVGLIILGWTRGRRNERRHLQELAAREEELRDVLIFATRYPPLDRGTLDPCLVGGSAVVAADHFKMFVAGLRKFVGGRFDAYETLIDRARRQALLRMKEQARAAGCDMVFNVRVETTRTTVDGQGTGTAMEVFAYGTAFQPARGSVAESLLQHRPGPELPVAESGAGFNLAGHPATRSGLLLWGVLVGWTMVELMALQSYWYVAAAPWFGFIVLAVLGCAAGIWALVRRGVPKATAIGFALLLSATLPPLLYFPALRINALSDFSSVEPSLYRLRADRVLAPQDPLLPELNLPDYRDYFEAQPIGAEYPIVLRRGWLGFWQMERESLAPRLKAFYRSR